MFGNRFIIWKLALRNLIKQRFQSRVMLFLLFITTTALFYSDYLAQSMKDGLKSAKERMGADLIVVPDRFVSGIEDALFLGLPCTVNFDKKWLYKISEIEGVNKVTFQLYIASLSMDCCDSSLQLIAYDTNSDFVITPWLSGRGIKQIKDNEIVLGCNMKKKKGDTVKYYGRQFKVIDVLDETGMGYDNCAFISYWAAYEIANDPKYDNILPFGKHQKVISMVLVRLKDGQTTAEVKDRILDQYQNGGIAVYTTNGLIRRLSERISDFNIYAVIFRILFLLSATVALYGMYSITIHLRKSEFGTFLSFGTRKPMLLSMLICEMFLIVLVASMLGILAVCLITIPFHEAMKKLLAIPFRQPDLIKVITISLKTLCINLLVCILASVKSFYELAHLEVIKLIKADNQ